jgi:SWI/SNF chromatin-remodeling complex subunit SWI1
MQSVQQQQQQMGQMTPVQANASLPPSNGWSTPQSVPAAATPQAAIDNRKSVSVTRQLEGSPAQAKQPTFATPPPSKLPERSDSTSKITNGNVVPSAPWQNPTNYQPNTRKLSASWGGLDVDQANNIGETLVRLKPDVPDVPEMGNLDVHAITRSLQSGIAGEVRYALDYLVKISNEHRIYLDLDMCEDLTDVLIDCAEEQVDILAEEAPEVSDILDLSSYEDVIRNVKTEIHGLQDIPEAGTLAYRLDRAADRLIAITTILRNLSFSLPGMEKNQHVLSAPAVIKLVSNAIRLVGTRMLFLRSHLNTQDFMKDIVVFLSNVADKVLLPSRDDALSILHFLLSFAPRPCPTTLQPLRFTPYNPTIHPYYPPAIDSLAKLLARDEPNRSFYKHIFLENISSSTEIAVYQQYDLLTRAFAFAIAVVPERVSSRAPANQADFLRLVEARKPQLTQGLLAADILSTLCPSVEVGLAKAWLQAEDGWAPSLIRLALLLIRRDVEIHQQRAARHPGGAAPRHNPKEDDAAYALITPRVFGTIKRLGQKSIDLTSLPSHIKDEAENAEAESEAPGSDEGFAGGEVKAINLDGALGDDNVDVDLGRKGERKGVFDGFNGEIVPKSDFLLGVLFLIGIDQGVLREVWEVAEVWENA